VQLPFNVNDEGFYDVEKMVQFFFAVDRASRDTKIAWNAYYNDAKVFNRVNKQLGKDRILFVGGGDSHNPDGSVKDEGSIHNGPYPYILHVHFNIMPTELAGQYLAGKGVVPIPIDLGEEYE
jgi:hypothetical protein